MAGDCQTVDACFSVTTQRMANEAFFTHISPGGDDNIHTEPTSSFGLLVDPDPQQQALTWADPQRHAGKRPTRVLICRVARSSTSVEWW